MHASQCPPAGMHYACVLCTVKHFFWKGGCLRGSLVLVIVHAVHKQPAYALTPYSIQLGEHEQCAVTRTKLE